MSETTSTFFDGGFAFRTLSPEEEQDFRDWARQNHRPGEFVSPSWHPVARAECALIDDEAAAASS